MVSRSGCNASGAPEDHEGWPAFPVRGGAGDGNRVVFDLGTAIAGAAANFSLCWAHTADHAYVHLGTLHVGELIPKVHTVRSAVTLDLAGDVVAAVLGEAAPGVAVSAAAAEVLEEWIARSLDVHRSYVGMEVGLHGSRADITMLPLSTRVICVLAEVLLESTIQLSSTVRL